MHDLNYWPGNSFDVRGYGVIYYDLGNDFCDRKKNGGAAVFSFSPHPAWLRSLMRKYATDGGKNVRLPWSFEPKIESWFCYIVIYTCFLPVFSDVLTLNLVLRQLPAVYNFENHKSFKWKLTYFNGSAHSDYSPELISHDSITQYSQWQTIASKDAFSRIIQPTIVINSVKVESLDALQISQ